MDLKTKSQPNSEASAFPMAGDDYNFQRLGLTKREWFAGMAMQGYCAHPDLGTDTVEQISEYAIEQADALLKALAAQPEEKQP